MFRRIILTALFAGILGGLGITVIQEFTTTPLILEAEKFEQGAPATSLLPHLFLVRPAHGHGGEVQDVEGRLQRSALTAAANILTAVGFALLMTACFALVGRQVDGGTGVLWGMAGFAAFALSPALGLPPELPGSMSAELGARQSWWLFCVLSSVAGLWLMILRRGQVWKVAGILLLVLPHAIGAPQPEKIGGAVPPELAAHFAAASIVTAAVFWWAIGWLSGTCWARLDRTG